MSGAQFFIAEFQAKSFLFPVGRVLLNLRAKVQNPFILQIFAILGYLSSSNSADLGGWRHPSDGCKEPSIHGEAPSLLVDGVMKSSSPSCS